MGDAVSALRKTPSFHQKTGIEHLCWEVNFRGRMGGWEMFHVGGGNVVPCSSRGGG